VILRNFEGFITTYNEPNDYTGHTVARPERPAINLEAGQEGVAGILAGLTNQIKPEGFDCTHQRVGQEMTPWTANSGLLVGETSASFDAEAVPVSRAPDSRSGHSATQR
jgi:lysine 2,3-aminomutase